MTNVLENIMEKNGFMIGGAAVTSGVTKSYFATLRVFFSQKVCLTYELSQKGLATFVTGHIRHDFYLEGHTSEVELSKHGSKERQLVKTLPFGTLCITSFTGLN